MVTVNVNEDPVTVEVGATDSGHRANTSNPHAVTHAQTTGQTADDHHDQAHAHDGADGSGTVAHSATTGRTANDHHNQQHALNSGTDHTGALGDGQHGDRSAEAAVTHHGVAQISGAATDADLDAHTAATVAHGATGAVVGTTNVQTLTNKTLTTPTIGDLTNAQHSHAGAASGGQVSHGALTTVGADDHHTQDHASRHAVGGADALNLADLIKGLLQQDQWNDIPLIESWTNAAVGTGAAENGVRYQLAKSGATAASSYVRYTGNAGRRGYSIGKTWAVLNWSKPIVLHMTFTLGATGTNGVHRVTWGKADADGVGALDDKGIGILVETAALKGICHNGTREAEVDLSTSLVTSTVHTITITSDGAGNVEWFLDGVSVGTSTGGPTGDSADQHTNIQQEVTNGADSVDYWNTIHSLKVYVEQ